MSNPPSAPGVVAGRHVQATWQFVHDGVEGPVHGAQAARGHILFEGVRDEPGRRGKQQPMRVFGTCTACNKVSQALLTDDQTCAAAAAYSACRCSRCPATVPHSYCQLDPCCCCCCSQLLHCYLLLLLLLLRTVGLPAPDECAHGWRGHDGVLAHVDLLEAVSCSQLHNDLRSLLAKVPGI